METQQKENKTLAADIHCFKIHSKRCAFNNDTATICIFIQSFRDSHNVAGKVYEKDQQTLSEIIRLVEKLTSAEQVIVITTSLRHSATTVMILAISLRTAMRKLPNQGHLIITTDLSHTCIATTAAGTGHTPSIIDTSKGTVLIGQDHVIDPSATEAPVTTGGMHPTLYLTMIAVLVTPL